MLPASFSAKVGRACSFIVAARKGHFGNRREQSCQRRRGHPLIGRCLDQLIAKSKLGSYPFAGSNSCCIVKEIRAGFAKSSAASGR